MWELKLHPQSLQIRKFYSPPAISVRAKAVWNSDLLFSFLTWKPVTDCPQNLHRVVPYVPHLSSEFQFLPTAVSKL